MFGGSLSFAARVLRSFGCDFKTHSAVSTQKTVESGSKTEQVSRNAAALVPVPVALVRGQLSSGRNDPELTVLTSQPLAVPLPVLAQMPHSS